MPMTPDKLRNLSKIIILLAAFASMLLSIGLWFLGDDKLAGIFVGLWVPSILAFGVIFLDLTDRRRP
jgi:hypothetical protein